MKGIHIGMQRRKTIQALLFISPWIIGFLLFFLYPIITSLRLSFGKLTNIVGLQTTWSGLENYLRAFTVDVEFIPLFLKQIQTTFLYTPLITVFSLILAILLNQKIKCKGLFRCVFFLPVLLGSGVVMMELEQTGMNTRSVLEAVNILLPSNVMNYLGAGLETVLNFLFYNMIIDYLLKITRAIFYGDDMYFFFIIFNCINDSVIFIKELSVSFSTILTNFS